MICSSNRMARSAICCAVVLLSSLAWCCSIFLAAVGILKDMVPSYVCMSSTSIRSSPYLSIYLRNTSLTDVVLIYSGLIGSMLTL